MGLESLLEPGKLIFTQLTRISIKAVGVLIILLIGWLISNLLKTVVIRVLKTIKVDLLSDRVELDTLLNKGGIKLTLSELIGEVAYWFGVLITFVIAVNAFGLTIAAGLLGRIILYIPNILAAIFILLLGILGATVLGKITKTAAVNAGVSQANLFGSIVKIVLMIFVAIITLQQLDIGTQILELTISILLATIGLGIAIAFGLGCKDIAARLMEDWLKKLK